MPPERRTQGFSVAHRAKRRAFAEAAWRVFLRDGLGGTTARAIAAETGASVGALYTYFPGTESVVQNLALGSLRLVQIVSPEVDPKLSLPLFLKIVIPRRAVRVSMRSRSIPWTWKSVTLL